MTTAPPIPCPTCRYDLRGLLHAEGATCPECGGMFTLQQLPTHPPHRVRTRTLLIFLACTPFVVIVTAVLHEIAGRMLGVGQPISLVVAPFATAFLWSTCVMYPLLRRDMLSSSRLYPLLAAPLIGTAIAAMSVITVGIIAVHGAWLIL